LHQRSPVHLSPTQVVVAAGEQMLAGLVVLAVAEMVA